MINIVNWFLKKKSCQLASVLIFLVILVGVVKKGKKDRESIVIISKY